MNLNFVVVFSISIFLSCIKACRSFRYDNYTLYNVVPVEREHLKFLQNLEREKYMDIVYWKRPYKLHNDVQLIVHPSDKELFLERTRHYKLDVNVLLPDVQLAFDNQVANKKYMRLRLDSYSWDQYYDLDDIYQWLADIALKYSNITQLDSIGRTAEGREIFALSIQRPGPKHSVIVEGGIHGHEWISPAFVTYLIHQIVHADASQNYPLKSIAKKFHWYLVPVANPDGYAFTHKTNRMWRKNRRHVGKGIGVDLNRNFDYSFGKHDTSTDPRDDHYCGSAAFSEPETKFLAEFIQKRRSGLKFYISVHAYGQMIVIPYADRVKHVENFSEMENYGKQAILKMFRMYGIKYRLGTTFDTMGLRISGNSASWVKKNFKTQYVISFVLRDNGSYGLALPPEQILPTCKETLAGLVEMMTARPRHVAVSFDDAAPSTKSSSMMVIMCFVVMFLK